MLEFHFHHRKHLPVVWFSSTQCGSLHFFTFGNYIIPYGQTSVCSYGGWQQNVDNGAIMFNKCRQTFPNEIQEEREMVEQKPNLSGPQTAIQNRSRNRLAQKETAHLSQAKQAVHIVNAAMLISNWWNSSNLNSVDFWWPNIINIINVIIATTIIMLSFIITLYLLCGVCSIE